MESAFHVRPCVGKDRSRGPPPAPAGCQAVLLGRRLSTQMGRAGREDPGPDRRRGVTLSVWSGVALTWEGRRPVVARARGLGDSETAWGLYEGSPDSGNRRALGLGLDYWAHELEVIKNVLGSI